MTPSTKTLAFVWLSTSFALTASGATIGPIPIFGTGSYLYCCGSERVTEYDLAGEADGHSVTILGGASESGFFDYVDLTMQVRSIASGEATIDGYTSDWFDFSFSSGGGILNLYAQDDWNYLGPIVTTAVLSGYLDITSFWSAPPPLGLQSYQLTYSVGVPEPRSSGMLALALLATISKHLWYRNPRRASSI